MNKFEDAAAAYRRKRNPSWPHEVETYLSQKVDWFLVGICAAMILIGIGVLSAIV